MIIEYGHLDHPAESLFELYYSLNLSPPQELEYFRENICISKGQMVLRSKSKNQKSGKWHCKSTNPNFLVLCRRTCKLQCATGRCCRWYLRRHAS